MGFEMRLTIMLLSLKIQAEKKYDEKECNERLAYIFENIESLKEYLLDNGLDYMNSQQYLEMIISTCVYKEDKKSGKVLALKRVCDSTITDNRKNKDA